MRFLALADLHLSISTPDKTMEVFGEPWIDYHEKISTFWRQEVQKEDVVLLPGDISWAMKIKEATADFAFIEALPGNKLLIRGNHDYWSSISGSAINRVMPSNMFYLSQGIWISPNRKIAVIGCRLWDHPSIKIDALLFQSSISKTSHSTKPYTDHDLKIFLREFSRLEKALNTVPDEIETIIVMTHYPPISSDGSSSPISDLLETDKRIQLCVFGHLHGVEKPLKGFGCIRGIHYELVAADFLDFHPKVLM